MRLSLAEKAMIVLLALLLSYALWGAVCEYASLHVDPRAATQG